MKEYIVSSATLQKTLDYLATRPYVEVFELIREIQASRGIPEPVKASRPAFVEPGGEQTATTPNN